MSAVAHCYLQSPQSAERLVQVGGGLLPINMQICILIRTLSVAAMRHIRQTRRNHSSLAFRQVPILHTPRAAGIVTGN
jgi:hypothetical protein